MLYVEIEKELQVPNTPLFLIVLTIDKIEIWMTRARPCKKVQKYIRKSSESQLQSASSILK
jgi:hypothetical protein